METIIIAMMITPTHHQAAASIVSQGDVKSFKMGNAIQSFRYTDTIFEEKKRYYYH
jgi:hypothetical protein